MSKCKTKIAAMIRMGYRRRTINGVKCLKIYSERMIHIASANKDGFMTVKQAATIQQKYGKAYRVNTLWDTSRNCRRITGMDFYVAEDNMRFSADDRFHTQPWD